MSSLTADVESPSSGHKNDRLTRWVEEVAQMCKPERVHWCDGSPEEYQALLRLMVLTGTAIPLNEEKRPNSFLVRSGPGDVAREADRCSIPWAMENSSAGCTRSALHSRPTSRIRPGRAMRITSTFATFPRHERFGPTARATAATRCWARNVTH